MTQQNASQAGVPLYTFQDLGALQWLATQTNGAALYVSSTRQLVQMYGSLANMLSGNVSVYRSVWALKMNGTTSPSCPPPTKGLSPGIIAATCWQISLHKRLRGKVSVIVNDSVGFRGVQ
ncbi:hypothetical protein [Burkholderia ambifaria]|uniref:hypothetical protein n=1 Tax=Burkholderia ambifaria TaxID=152480 RepID=UPI001589385D|nr:hypothetical protein [Burkholderia ambifaria]